MAANKVQLANGTVLLDLTSDTVDAAHLAQGYTAHDKKGDLIVGTMSGGGSGAMNVQGYHGMGYSKQASLVATGVALTVAKTGRYKISWMGFRNNTSGSWSSQLYINGSSYGSAVTTFTSTYGQSVVLENVDLAQGQKIEVRAKARSTSYYFYVGNLIIEQVA